MLTFTQAIEDLGKSDGGANPNHDEHGRFASGGGGNGDKVTSDQMNEFVYAVQSTTELDGSLEDVSDHANSMSDAATELQNALDGLGMNVDDEDGDSQKEAAILVRDAYEAMKTFSVTADKSLA